MLKVRSPGARRLRRMFLAAALLAASAHAPGAASEPIALDVRPAPLAENLKAGATVDRLRFLGMLVIPNVTIDGAPLSQLSDLAWDEDDQVLYALSDKGMLFHLHPVIRDGVLSDLKVSRAAPLKERGSGARLRDRRRDAEGLDILNGANGQPGDAVLLVSFERDPRILRYRPDGTAVREYRLPKALSDVDAYASGNRMLEAVCHDDRLGVLTAPEKPLAGEPDGHTRLYSVAGRSWRYPIDPQDRIVALHCLGDGDVLVLEGNFGIRFWRSHATLKRTRLSDSAAPDAPLTPQTLFRLQSAQGYQIDNFEGLAHHQGNRYFLVSDNNDLFLQRTLLLYFELLD